MEIPFDRHIAEIYSMGEILVEVMPEWKEKFKELYRRIIREIEKRRESA
jgi:MinD superfamily P-loop ATPase